MNHFVKGKVLLIDTTATNNFGFVMQLDSSREKAMIIASDELMASSKLYQLKRGQYVKIKGYEIEYTADGKSHKQETKTYLINKLQILN